MRVYRAFCMVHGAQINNASRKTVSYHIVKYRTVSQRLPSSTNSRAVAGEREAGLRLCVYTQNLPRKSTLTCLKKQGKRKTCVHRKKWESSNTPPPVEQRCSQHLDYICIITCELHHPHQKKGEARWRSPRLSRHWSYSTSHLHGDIQTTTEEATNI